MDRKQIIEKQKALGSICQSKTGDAILRKNVFETRVLRTRLSELAIEEQRWKTNHSFEVREAKKEAHTRKAVKRRSFRDVAQVAFAANTFKNLITTAQKSDNESHQEADVAQEEMKEAPKKSYEEEKLKKQNEELQNTPQNKDESPTERAKNIPSREKTKTPSRHSNSLPEKSQHFHSSSLFTRPRGETFTGRSLKNTDVPRKVKSGIFTRGVNENRVCTTGVCSSSLSENPSLMISPIFDRRFLELEAILVPMNPNEESTSENEEEEDDDDESLGGSSSRSGSSMS